ncbi:MAG TPA: 3-isopropylmalate dehydratase [Burkholderiales bacterium]
MTATLRGSVRRLGDDINTDVHCSSKYMPGKDSTYIAQHAFEQVAPGFAAGFKPGDILVAGRNFGHNSSREQAAQVLKMMGAAALVSPCFGRQFFRNAINNGVPVIECDVADIRSGDEIEIDLGTGRLTVPARGLDRHFKPLAPQMQALLAAGGLIPFLQKHPDWNGAG